MTNPLTAKDPSSQPDWTSGTPQLLVSSCIACGHKWYLRRDLCPRCQGEVSYQPAQGEGRVAALTNVGRSALRESTDGHIIIGLVDLTEGVRVMARCSPRVAIGSSVTLSFPVLDSSGIPLPFFEIADQ